MGEWAWGGVGGRTPPPSPPSLPPHLLPPHPPSPPLPHTSSLPQHLPPSLLTSSLPTPSFSPPATSSASVASAQRKTQHIIVHLPVLSYKKVYDALNLKPSELSKRLNNCEKISELGFAVERPSSRFAAAFEQLTQTQEQAETLKNDANFTITF